MNKNLCVLGLQRSFYDSWSFLGHFSGPTHSFSLEWRGSAHFAAGVSPEIYTGWGPVIRGKDLKFSLQLKPGWHFSLNDFSFTEKKTFWGYTLYTEFILLLQAFMDYSDKPWIRRKEFSNFRIWFVEKWVQWLKWKLKCIKKSSQAQK